MSLKTPVKLGTVQETLLVPLWARAREAVEPHPVLHDPKSVEILGALDYDFSPIEGARSSQLGCCVRGALVDQWVRNFLDAHPDGAVVELGVGLNSRFERVDNGRATWFEIDLPDVIELRREFFTERSRRRMISASAHDEDWLAQVREATPGPVFIATEGVLVYFSPEQVRTLFARLADLFPRATVAYDSMTPLVVRRQKMHDAMRYFEAEFTWSVDDAREVETWDKRLTVVQSRSFFHMLYEHPKRLPACIRYFGALLGAIYPPVKRSYHVNLMRVG